MKCQENFSQTGEKKYLAYFMPEISIKTASDIMAQIEDMKEFDNFFYLIYLKDEDTIYYDSKPNNRTPLMEGGMLNDYIEKVINEYGDHPIVNTYNNIISLLRNLCYRFSMSDTQYRLDYGMVCKAADSVIILRNLREIQDFYSSIFKEAFILPYLVPITPWDK